MTTSTHRRLSILSLVLGLAACDSPDDEPMQAAKGPGGKADSVFPCGDGTTPTCEIPIEAAECPPGQTPFIENECFGAG